MEERKDGGKEKGKAMEWGEAGGCIQGGEGGREGEERKGTAWRKAKERKTERNKRTIYSSTL